MKQFILAAVVALAMPFAAQAQITTNQNAEITVNYPLAPAGLPGSVVIVRLQGNDLYCNWKAIAKGAGFKADVYKGILKQEYYWFPLPPNVEAIMLVDTTILVRLENTTGNNITVSLRHYAR